MIGQDQYGMLDGVMYQVIFNPVTKALEFDDNSDDDRGIKDGGEMLLLFKNIANSMTPMIKWEEDIACTYEDNCLPVFDVKMKKYTSYIIKHLFHKKEVANKKVISVISAMPEEENYAALIEELCRMLRNTSPSLVLELMTGLVEDFNIYMAESDHCEEFRLQVTEAAVKNNRKVLKVERNGGRQLYKDKAEIVQYRRGNREICLRSGWFQQLGYYVKGRVNLIFKQSNK